MRILFCADPLNGRRADPEYEREFSYAERLGMEPSLVSLEKLFAGDAAQAVRLVSPAEAAETVMYRGWMLKPHDYKQLYEALKLKNLSLINTPRQYVNGHYFPYSYETLRSLTPLSIWLDKEAVKEELANFPRLRERLSVFGSKPLLIKDYVKSRKHEWEEACYIPDASNMEHVKFVIGNFLEIQGDDLNGGVVFREFIELEQLASHPKSGMPLSNEFRLFFLHRQLLMGTAYWDEAADVQELPDLKPFVTLAQGMDSEFFTIDIAKTRRGEWIVIEAGDGQVSGLSAHTNIEAFYRVIREIQCGFL